MQQSSPALSDFGFGEGDGASGGGDFGERIVDGVDLDVVHEGLAGIAAGHESAVDAEVSVFGFDEPVIHPPGIGDLPSEGPFVEPDGALDVVCGDFKVSNRVWHSGRRIADRWVGWVGFVTIMECLWYGGRVRGCLSETSCLRPWRMITVVCLRDGTEHVAPSSNDEWPTFLSAIAAETVPLSRNEFVNGLLRVRMGAPSSWI